MTEAFPEPQEAALRRFEGLLRDRGIGLGLVAAADKDVIAERHVRDSLRALAAIGPRGRTALDLGSGAGLPGIPLAIARPELHFGLVESQRRRVAWLELVVDELGLKNVEVIHDRIEDVKASVDLCFARALAPPGRSWKLARPLLRPGGRLVYFAGASLDLGVIAKIAPIVRILQEPGLDSTGALVIIGDQ